MIIVKINRTRAGFRLMLKSHNGKKFNHQYDEKAGAKAAWKNFVKQIKDGKYQLIA